MDIEKALFPNSGKLLIIDGTPCATLVDDELDPLHCTFYDTGCVEINTQRNDYIVLSEEKLNLLIKLIDEAKIYHARDVIDGDLVY